LQLRGTRCEPIGVYAIEKQYAAVLTRTGQDGRERISRPPRSTAPAPLHIADSAGGRNRADVPSGGRRLLRSRWNAEVKTRPAIGARRVGVIGAGMVGVCAACWLQRDGYSVFLIESDEPGRG